MAVTINYTVEDLQTLSDAINKGIVEVQYSDKKIKYRSLLEMETLLRKLTNKLCPTKPKRYANRFFASHKKGTC